MFEDNAVNPEDLDFKPHEPASHPLSLDLTALDVISRLQRQRDELMSLIRVPFYKSCSYGILLSLTIVAFIMSILAAGVQFIDVRTGGTFYGIYMNLGMLVVLPPLSIVLDIMTCKLY